MFAFFNKYVTVKETGIPERKEVSYGETTCKKEEGFIRHPYTLCLFIRKPKRRKAQHP